MSHSPVHSLYTLPIFPHSLATPTVRMVEERDAGLEYGRDGVLSVCVLDVLEGDAKLLGGEGLVGISSWSLGNTLQLGQELLVMSGERWGEVVRWSMVWWSMVWWGSGSEVVKREGTRCYK